MCLNPKWIYKKGNYKEDNYRGAKGDFYELGTYSKCGCCAQCVAEKANNWVVRNYYEERAHEKKCFITLTYAESPIILVRRDLQNFIKRLRYFLDKENIKIRTFQCGEYGELNNRPHFHIIIYGWEDKKAYMIGINKKCNIIKRSDFIHKIWGKGITSYQEFESHEIPYIALYDTPKEQFKRAYRLNLEKCRYLKNYARSKNNLNEETRRNLQKEIKDIEKELKATKEEYYMVKEFNSWSLGLGWEEFYKEYLKSDNYVFTEYIQDKEFATPSPWVKKLANMGYYDAAQEMIRREQDIIQSKNEEEEILKNLNRLQSKRIEEKIQWIDRKDKIESL